MTFKPETICSLRTSVDESFTGLWPLKGDGVWAGLLSSGHCLLEGTSTALEAGDFFLGTGPLTLSATVSSHLVAVQLDGTAAEGLRSAPPRVLFGRSCPRCGETMALLLSGGLPPGRVSALGYALLCDLWEAETEEGGLPPLVLEAANLMREDYATLYGVEELADRLGVSKCHLVRVFSSAMGVPPGQYLTSVRLEAAKELLLLREYPLETVAGLCGFSGANYFCRVFRRVEGTTPTVWLNSSGAARYKGRAPVVL